MAVPLWRHPLLAEGGTRGDREGLSACLSVAVFSWLAEPASMLGPHL